MNNPDLYVGANNVTRCDIGNMTEEFSDEIRRMSGRCLDIGSGPGDTVVDLILPKLNANTSFVCSDISEEMLRYGKAAHKNNRRVSFVKLDIESSYLPKYSNEQYDHATSFYCLHWCQDISLAFKNIFNLLRPGGTTLLSFIARSTIFDAYEVLAAMPCYQPYMKDVGHYIPIFQHAKQPSEMLEALIKAVGFEIHHCSLRPKQHVFNTSQESQELLLAVNPFIERIPADLKENYVKDLFREFARRNDIINKSNNNQNQFTMSYKYATFVVYLRKPTDSQNLKKLIM